MPEYWGAQRPFDHDPLDGLIPCPLPKGLAVIHRISEMLKHGSLFLHRRRFFPLGEHRVKVDHCTGRSALRLAIYRQHGHSRRRGPDLIHAAHGGGLHGLVEQPRQYGHPLTERDLTAQIG